MVSIRFALSAVLAPGLTLMVACKDKKDDSTEPAAEVPDVATGGQPGGDTQETVGAGGGDEGGSDELPAASMYSFTCFADRAHSGTDPLFSPPFEVSQLHHKPSSPDFPFDANCDYDTDAACNPGEAIEPVGGLYMPATGMGHLKPTPHMYVSMSRTETVPLKNMAKGHVLKIVRTPNNEYGVQILHSCSVYSNYGHVSFLTNAKIEAALDAAIPNWDAPGSSWTIDFGLNNPMVNGTEHRVKEIVVLEQGEVWGTKTTAFGSGNIDFRVLDKRSPRGAIVNADHRTWSLDQFFGDVYELEIAQPFMNYFSDANKELWLRFLRIPGDKKPPMVAAASVDAGTATKDVAGKLQGLWFNPAVYGYQTGANGFANYEYTEAAVFTIFERVGEPQTGHLAYGLKDSFIAPDGFVETLPQLDPAAWPACGCDENQQACVDSCLLEQKRLSSYVSYFRGFYPRLDVSAPGPHHNVSPKDVSPSTGVVCYDIDADGGTKWDRLYVEMQSANRLRVKYFPTRTLTGECSTNDVVDMTTHAFTFVRGEGQ